MSLMKYMKYMIIKKCNDAEFENVVSGKYWSDCILSKGKNQCVSLSLGLWYNTYIEEKRFNPRAVMDDPDRQQPQNLTVRSGEENCEHIYFHVMVSSCLIHSQKTIRALWTR